MKCELAIFDLDGTLLNTLDDLADSVNHALGLSGFPEREVREVKGFVGNGIRKLIERSVPEDATEGQKEKVYRDFTEYYRIHCADKTAAYGGVCELLKRLRAGGVQTAVVSNKADYAVQELCGKFFGGLLDLAVGERDGISKKPAPDMVDLVLQRQGISRERAVYIGDSEVDLATAANAGLTCILVGWGFRDVGFLKELGAEIVVSTAEELEALLSAEEP